MSGGSIERDLADDVNGIQKIDSDLLKEYTSLCPNLPSANFITSYHIATSNMRRNSPSSAERRVV